MTGPATEPHNGAVEVGALIIRAFVIERTKRRLTWESCRQIAQAIIKIHERLKEIPEDVDCGGAGGDQSGGYPMTDKYTCAKCDYTAEDFERVLARFLEEDADDVAFENADLIVTALSEAAERRKTLPDDPETALEAKLATVGAPDNGTPQEVLSAVLGCARAWVPEARILGNVRAGDIVRALDAYEAHRREREPVKIKPLEWNEYHDEQGLADRWDAEAAPFHVYYGIELHHDGYRLFYDGEAFGPFDTIETARAAAQADYEARIRSALFDGGSNG